MKLAHADDVEALRKEAVRGDEEHPARLLAYGAREPDDVAWHPRSRKVYLCGVGVFLRAEDLDYREGEE